MRRRCAEASDSTFNLPVYGLINLSFCRALRPQTRSPCSIPARFYDAPGATFLSLAASHEKAQSSGAPAANSAAPKRMAAAAVP